MYALALAAAMIAGCPGGAPVGQQDSDGDGVPNNADECPNTPADESVDADGCAPGQLDSDGDGVFDGSDTCPDTETNATVNPDGCAIAWHQVEGVEFASITGTSIFNFDRNDNLTVLVFEDVEAVAGSALGSQFGNLATIEVFANRVDTTGEVLIAEATVSGLTLSFVSVTVHEAELQFASEGDVTASFDLEFEGVASRRYEYMMTGTLSDDGLTINWDSVEGTLTDTSGASPTTKAIVAVTEEDIDPDGDGIAGNSGDTADFLIVLYPWTQVPAPLEQPDADGDGSADEFDQCPNTPAGDEVDVAGCGPTQADSDGDGVTDADDDCPNTSDGETVDDNGCAADQFDEDNDGVIDDEDECPGTAPDTVVTGNGCPLEDLGVAVEAWTDVNAQFFNTAADAVYNLRDDGVLTVANIAVGDTVINDPDSDAEILANTAPRGVDTDFVLVTFESGNTTQYGIEYSVFDVDFDGTAVTWTFDITFSTIGLFGGLTLQTEERYVGEQTGTLVQMNGTTVINWTAVTGQVTIKTSGFLEDTVLDIADHAGGELGQWVLVELP